MQTSINPLNDPHQSSRTIGLLNELMALFWTGRWGFTCASVLALLINKQTAERLVRAKLMRRVKNANPYAFANAGLVLTKKGLARALELRERFKGDAFADAVLRERGFYYWIFTARATPALGKARGQVFNHDLKLQTILASLIRNFGAGWAATLGVASPSTVATTREMEREARRVGSRIADFRVTGTDDADAPITFLLEFESTRKRVDEVDRMCAQWSDTVMHSSRRVLVLCDTPALMRLWRVAIARDEVPRYLRRDGHWVKAYDEQKRLLMRPVPYDDRVQVKDAKWSEIKMFKRKPTRENALEHRTRPASP